MIRARAVTPLRSNSIRRQRARRRIARDVFGKPLSITRSGAWNGSPISESRRYVYDTHQRLCKRVEPETGASFASYDAAGNIAWTASGSALTAIDTASQCEADRSSVPTASQTVRTYDARNRVLGVAYPNGADGLAYRYFNDGALRTLSNGAGASLNTWTYTYDLRRLPTTETLAIDGRSSTITHAYDAYGHASQLTWPDGLTVPSTPNALGQPTQAGAYASAIAYFPNGGMSGFTYGNGIVHTLTQNTRELPLRSLDQKPGQSAILDDTYSYDANANVAAIADGTAGNAASRTMAYDGLDRLTTTHAPHQWWISATTSFDALDNIRTNQVGNTPSYLNTFSYDPTTWHLTAIAGHVNWALSYDANGNVTSKGAGNDAYGFDAANRLTAVTGKESYRYDGYGRRVKITRSTDGKIDYPVYDLGGQLLTEDDQRSNTTTDYVSLNGSLVAKRASKIGANQWTTSYEHTDALHSPRYETSATGTLTRAELYTPWGEPGDGKYVQGPGYTGHVTDAATHLTYAQQRYYDPVMGRFLSTDPVLADDHGGDFNRYWYANNNPYRFVDPDGRYVCTGGKTSCAQISQALDKVSDRFSSMRGVGSISAELALGKIAKFYGKAGVNNGVTVGVGDPKNGGVGGTLRHEDGTTTITINLAKIQSITFLAGALYHEGQHGLDAYSQHEDSFYSDASYKEPYFHNPTGNPLNRGEELWTERNAARSEAYAYWALGVDMRTWTKASSINQLNIEAEAQRATKIWCDHGGGCQ